MNYEEPIIELLIRLPSPIFRNLLYLSDKRGKQIEAMIIDAITQYLREAFEKEEANEPNKYV